MHIEVLNDCSMLRGRRHGMHLVTLPRVFRVIMIYGCEREVLQLSLKNIIAKSWVFVNPVSVLVNEKAMRQAECLLRGREAG